jgi:surface protein
MFNNCSNLINLDISNFKTNKVEDMRLIFQNCSKLINLNLINFNSENLFIQYYLFIHCSLFNKLYIYKFITQNNQNMTFLFNKYYNFNKLDVTKFIIENVIDKKKIFKNYTKLINFVKNNFNIRNVIISNKNIKYTLVNIIGEGGFGICYMAKDENNKFYAIKEIKIQNKDVAFNEIKILKIMKSKYSVEFIESIEKDDNIYIVMELCDGNLIDLLEKKNINLNIVTIIKIINQLNEVLKLMHSKKIEHRDLKPENILIKYNYDYLFKYIIIGDMGKILIK